MTVTARVFSAMAFLALLLAVAVPPGYMPARAADNSIIITVCTGMGPINAVMKMDMAADHDGHPGKGSSDPREKCPYAGHQAPQNLPDLTPVDLPAIGYVPEIVTPLKPSVQPGLGLSAPPPPSHAPPQQLI